MPLVAPTANLPDSIYSSFEKSFLFQILPSHAEIAGQHTMYGLLKCSHAVAQVQSLSSALSRCRAATLELQPLVASCAELEPHHTEQLSPAQRTDAFTAGIDLADAARRAGADSHPMATASWTAACYIQQEQATLAVKMPHQLHRFMHFLWLQKDRTCG